LSPSKDSTILAGASSRPPLLLSAFETSRLTFQLQLTIGRSAMLNAAGRCRPEAEPSARACSTGRPPSLSRT
jgi:hypothetical protein